MAKARTLVLNTKVNVTGADQLRGLGRTLQRTGGLLTAGLTLPLVGVGAAMLTAAQDAERAQAKLTNVFDSMGAAAFTSVKALNAHAEALQNATTFDDESINEAQAVLLTFGNVTGDAFTRATEAALDLSSLFEGDLQAATIQIGKALNDPTKGLTALAKAGVSFTQQQKDQIKALQQSGDLLGAQTIILAELERQFGGTAEALAGTAGGQMTQALNQLGEASEEFGAAIAPVLVDVAKGLKEFAKWLRQLNPETKEWVLRIGLLAAALGPVLIVVGTLVRAFAGLRTAGLLLLRVAPLIGASFHLMLGPLGLVTAGVTALAAAFATDFLGVRTRFEKDMGDIGDILGDAGDAFRGFFGIVEKGSGIEAMAESEKAGWAAYGERIAGTIDAAAKVVETGVTDMAAEAGLLPEKMADELLAAQFHLTDAATQLVNFMAEALSPMQEKAEAQAFLASDALATALGSPNPLVQQKAAELAQQAVDVLNGMSDPNNKSGFYAGGRKAGLAWSAGLVSAYGTSYSAGVTLASGAGLSLRGLSPPKEGPLKDIDKGGLNIGLAWAKGLAGARDAVSAVANTLAGAAIPGFGRAMGLGGLRLSAVPVGAGGGGGTVINNFYLQWDGERPRGRTEAEIVANLQRLSPLIGGKLAAGY